VHESLRVHAGRTRSAAEAEALARRLEVNPPVPAATSIVSRTGSGDQDLSELDGAVDARTGSGSLRVE
jgi:hypothetical protein